MIARHTCSTLVIAAAAALLSACGGSDEAPAAARPEVSPAASDAVPATARQSAGGLVDWLRALVRESDAAENKPPLDVTSLQLPTADEAEAPSVR